MDWIRLITWVPFMAFYALFDVDNYYDWRNRDQSNRVTPDRDEAPPGV